MISFEDGTMINHCFCYMTEGQKCKRVDCTGNKRTPVYFYKIPAQKGSKTSSSLVVTGRTDSKQPVQSKKNK